MAQNPSPGVQFGLFKLNPGIDQVPLTTPAHSTVQHVCVLILAVVVPAMRTVGGGAVGAGAAVVGTVATTATVAGEEVVAVTAVVLGVVGSTCA